MVLTFLTPNVITKLPSPTKVKENGLNPQTEFVMKHITLVATYRIQRHITPNSLCTVS